MGGELIVSLYRSHSDLVVGPFIACTMNCLNPVKSGIDEPEFVSDTADITVDRISFHQALACDIVQSFICLDVTRSTSQ